MFFYFLVVCFALGSASTQLLITDKEEVSKKNQVKLCDLQTVSPNGSELIKLPFYVSGYDYDEYPVVVLEWGRWDTQWLVEHPAELETFYSHLDHFISDVLTGIFFEQLNSSVLPYKGLMVIIIDYDGLDLRTVRSAAAIQVVMTAFTKYQRLAGQFAYGFALNANAMVDQLISLSKPLMGNFLDRIEVHGTISSKWIPQVLKKIPASQLPPKFGGCMDFKPLAYCSFL